MATFNPDSLQKMAIQQSSEFGKWNDYDCFPSHQEISYAKSLGKLVCSYVTKKDFIVKPKYKS